MKKLNLPLTHTVSATINFHDLDESALADLANGQTENLLGRIVDEEILTLMESARNNGGRLLYATTSIEKQMESILFWYFMGPFKGPDARSELFETEILQSSALSYNAKRSLLDKVINEDNLLKGKDKNKLRKELKDIMDWRNAFAHGSVQHDTLKGCFIKFYSGRVMEQPLNNEFWTLVESTFHQCHERLNKAKANLEDKS